DGFDNLFHAASSQANQIMSSLASGLAGMGIAAGFSFLYNLGKKNGSEVNNNLVQNVQNPYTYRVGEISNQFDADRAAGTLSVDDIMRARDEIIQLTKDFRRSADEYAAKGEKEATAVKNMFATIDQNFGPGLSKILGKFQDALTEVSAKTETVTIDFGDTTEAIEKVDEVAKAFNDSVDAIINQL